jgi:hypothetical protein
MGAKVFFSLERIPARYGAGYKAKMKRRETRTAEECARLDTRLRGMPHKMMVTHCEAILDAMFRVAAETGCICRLGDYLRAFGLPLTLRSFAPHNDCICAGRSVLGCDCVA